MHKLILADATEFELVDHIEQVKVMVQGANVDGIRFTVTNTTVAAVQEAFKDPVKTDVIKQAQEDGSVMSTQTGFTKLKSITRDEEAHLEGVEKLTIVMRMPEDLTDTIKSLGTKVVELGEALAEATAPFDPHSLDLAGAKEYQVKQSELALENYLANHPVKSSVHGEKEAYYSCTLLKQQLLTQAIALAQMAVQTSNKDYKISWNATGEECTYDWTLEELVQLSFEFDAYVRPYVSAQQELENDILACSTVDEVLAVEIDYSKVTHVIPPASPDDVIEKSDEPITGSDGTSEESEVAATK